MSSDCARLVRTFQNGEEKGRTFRAYTIVYLTSRRLSSNRKLMKIQEDDINRQQRTTTTAKRRKTKKNLSTTSRGDGKLS